MRKLALIAIIIVASVLRLYALNKVPVSLFGDELDVGYQAYSILKTGKDYYGNSWPIHFHSLAEWRTPLYLYSAVPTVAIFGISSLGVRLPAAFFGILSVYAMYLLVREIFKNDKLALFSALLMALSPWSIQYSRAAFEVTELIFFLLIGLLFYFKSLKSGKYLWLSLFAFALTPWIYSTAKFFTPILLTFLFFLHRKEILSLPKKYIFYALLALLIVGGPIAYDTLFGGGTQRYGYISVFTDPVTEPEVGTARLIDARARGEKGEGLSPNIIDRSLHNKFTFWGGNIARNYIQPFSSDFLFNRGDPNLRHSIEGVGMLYKVEVILLLLGLIFFFTEVKDKKAKLFIAFWILAGILPASITRDGGNHATRLIVIMPPLIFLLACGATKLFSSKSKVGLSFSALYTALFVINFIFYQHNFWVHNPTYSERWWHAGYEESIKTIKEKEKDYDRVIISTANEPPWVFFAAWYEYPPDKWQANFPLGNDEDVPGFGKISHTDKFYFGSPQGGLYEWGQVLDEKTLYLATEKEVKVNLIMEPQRVPQDLTLVKSIAYPSGEPAFYIFSGK